MNDISTQEAEVNLGRDFLIDSFVNVVTLIRGFGLAAFEVFVEFVVVLEKQEEDFMGGVDDTLDGAVTLGYKGGFEGFWADEHALQDVDHLDLQLWVGNALVY